VLREGAVAAFEPRALVRHVVHPPDFIGHLRYQWQSRFFPRLVGRVPELRGELLTARLFLGTRSLHAAGAGAAFALGRRHRCTYVLALPYINRLAGVGRRARSPRVAAVEITKHLIADGVREAALVWGSARYRTPVL
jgi:hypothetical protein